MQHQLFVDMDGVLVDFENGITELINKYLESFDRNGTSKKDKLAEKIVMNLDRIWIYPEELKYKVVRNLMFPLICSSDSKGFWSELKWVPGGKELWNSVKKYNPMILTSPVEGDPDCAPEKIEWCQSKLGLDASRVIVKTNKHEHAIVDGIPAVLIDDTPKKIDAWTNAGGIGILYTTGNPGPAIRALKGIIEKDDS